MFYQKQSENYILHNCKNQAREILLNSNSKLRKILSFVVLTLVFVPPVKNVKLKVVKLHVFLVKKSYIFCWVPKLTGSLSRIYRLCHGSPFLEFLR